MNSWLSLWVFCKITIRRIGRLAGNFATFIVRLAVTFFHNTLHYGLLFWTHTFLCWLSFWSPINLLLKSIGATHCPWNHYWQSVVLIFISFWCNKIMQTYMEFSCIYQDYSPFFKGCWPLHFKWVFWHICWKSKVQLFTFSFSSICFCKIFGIL